MTIFYRGKLGSNYVFWNNNESIPFGVTDIIVVNSPVLTASSVDGPINALNGLSGSLQTLSDGSPYLLAGNNINLVTNSLGQVEITGSNGSSIPGGFDTQIQYNNSGNFSGVNVLTFFSGSLYATGSFKGILDGTSSLAINSLTASYVLNAVSSSYATSTLTASYAINAGNALSASYTANADLLDNLDSTAFARLTIGNIFTANQVITGSIIATTGFSGSLTKLTDGSSYIIAGSGIGVNSASNGAITISAIGSSTPTLQQIYNSGSSAIGVSNSPGPVVISGSLSQVGLNYPPLLRLETGKGGIANYNAIDILGFSGGTSGSLISIGGNSSVLGGGRIMMRSTAGTPSKLSWLSGAGQMYWNATAAADIYYLPNDNALYFDAAGGNQKYIIKDNSGESGTGNIAQFEVATTSFGGKVRFFTGANASNASVINSGTLEQVRTAKFTANTTFTGSAGYFGINVTNTADAALILSGTDTKGGAGYFNFLYVSNSYSASVNRVKNFRLANDGTFEIISSDYNTNIFAISDAGNLTIPGGYTASKASSFFGVKEKFNTKTGATGTIIHDCSTGHIFYHSGATGNWTSNFTNLSMSNGYATTITLVVTQSSNAYIPSAIQIDGAGQTLNWQGNVIPTGTANRIDVISFSILNVSSSYIVLGQFVSF